MKRFGSALFALVLIVLATAVQAQTNEPQINITIEQDEVLVGQPFVLRLKVLVPTFMPKPPVFPTFEMPGLIVRLPERSTSPVSERIEGATWAGVQRTYRIYPMQAGTTDIPAQQISIVYKDTDTNEDVPLTVDVPATQIVATVPPGARTLDPLILAQDLQIEQTWQLAEGELAVGDAVVRKLEISVDGASALFVPPLIEAASPSSDAPQPKDGAANAAFLAYPEDSTVTETMERGVMSGTRTETVSYIAQSGGAAVFPDITLSWYDLATDSVEEILLEGRTVSVAMPPHVRTAADRQQSRRAAFLLVLLLGGAWASHRWIWPMVRPRFERLTSAYAASVHAAHRSVEQQAKAQDLGGVVQALDLRAMRGHGPSTDLTAALQNLTRAIYSDGAASSDIDAHWRRVRQALHNDRPRLRGKSRKKAQTELAPLNPFT